MEIYTVGELVLVVNLGIPTLPVFLQMKMVIHINLSPDVSL